VYIRNKLRFFGSSVFYNFEQPFNQLNMTSQEIRQTFLRFFEKKGHKIVPSAPLVIKDDPTLMFTNAGMNQFKDYFLGYKTSPYPRIADTQKCLRVSGKHNDLEEVGLDTYHHTMFEMLGNWSFGDYFKKEAIEWAWELLTQVYGIAADRLYVTYFEGDAEENIPKDDEVQQIWSSIVPSDRILPGNKKDNFWEMGDVGPCGPCSEIHIDLRSDSERKEVPGQLLVNKGHPKVIELWNLVFIQYNRTASGKLEPLPNKHVDTGMGLERLVRVIQGKESNYDTDLFRPIIERLEEMTNLKYGQDEKVDIAMRVVADHIRAVSFAIADGQLPSNVKAGYVIRRILRRAVRYGYSFLNFREPFLVHLYPVLCRIMGDQFPELEQQKLLVLQVIQEEEKSFLQTLANGIRRFEWYLDKYPDTNISGDFAFELYDTYGFPIDLTQLMAREKGLSVDIARFNELLEEQRNRSRKDAEVTKSDWIILAPSSETEFLGYDLFETKARILRYRKIEQKGKTLYQLVLDKTTMYPEGGGQVGDRGWLIQNEVMIDVVYTIKENDLIIHLTEKIPENLDGEWMVRVDSKRRLDTMRNHSATHLLHWALRKVLGTHVEQKGSLVHPDYLRFDFSHFQKMTPEELLRVEQEVNQLILQNILLQEYRRIPFSKALEMNAMALFGEKYGEEVRVIQFGESKELCGGTHVRATGQIGIFKIIEETAVAAGVRRIEAVTGRKALEYFQHLHQKFATLKNMLKGKDPIEVIEEQKTIISALEKQIADYKQKEARYLAKDLINKAVRLNDVLLLIEAIKNNKDLALRDIAFQFRQEKLPLMALLYSIEDDNKVQVTLYIDESLVKKYNLHAGQQIKDIVQPIEGKGGGQDIVASAAGKNPRGVPLMIEKFKEWVTQAIK
jgi:alanyl-tRNA synthetase